MNFMKARNSLESQAKVLRVFRRVHRATGALLFVFFFVISLSGILLGWKKNSNGLILAKSHVGTSTVLKDWLPLDSLHTIACSLLHTRVDNKLSLDLDRIDIRKDKGMVKFVFTDSFWGLQLDGVTGELLHIERRRADFIEKLHDGSILDYLFRTTNGQIKLVYTSVTGLALLLFTVTGFWLWYGPKRLRKSRKKTGLI
jgi:uncharacterized iron-regulated membrane protein